MAAEHIDRPAGRPPAGGYEYTVELGTLPSRLVATRQRLILVVVDKPDAATGQLNLMPRYFFLVTNWSEESRSAEQLLAHYRKRGTFEDRLGEFNESIGVHLSSQGFKDNEATMLLALLAFNLNSICRIELEDSLGGCWDLQRFRSVCVEGGRRDGQAFAATGTSDRRIGRTVVVTSDWPSDELEDTSFAVRESSRLHAAAGSRAPERSASLLISSIAKKNEFGEGAVVRHEAGSEKPTSSCSRKNRDPIHTLQRTW